MPTSSSPDKSIGGGENASCDTTAVCARKQTGAQPEVIKANENNSEGVEEDGRYERHSPLFAGILLHTGEAGKAADCFTAAHNLLKEVKAVANLPNLNVVIRLLHSAASNWPSAKSGRPESLHHLATALLIRFILTADEDDVNHAISLRGAALGRVSQNALQQILEQMLRDVHTDATADTGESMATAALILKGIFPIDHTSKLDTALACYQEALSTLKGHSEQWIALWELSEALLIKFYLTGQDAYVDEAITHLRCVQQTKFNRTIGLCAALVTAYNETRPAKHCIEAAEVFLTIYEKDEEARKLMEKVDPQLQQEWNLEGAIETCKEAESLLSWGNGQRAMVLGCLGNLLEAQFGQHGDPKDLGEAIQLYREALDICVAPHPDHDMFLYNLGGALDTRYEHDGDLDDINEAVQLHKRSLKLRPFPHPNRVESLNRLGIEMHRLYQRRGEPQHTDEAIRLLREALDLCPSSHPLRSTSLSTLAVAIKARYTRRGNPADIEEAVQFHRDALELHDSPNSDRSSFLNNLAGAIHTRYQQQRAPKDINEAIELYEEALQLCASESSDLDWQRSIFLNNLAGAIHERYEQEKDRDDIDEAISLHRQSVELRLSPHPLRSTSLHNLAEAIHTCFKRKGDSKHIYEAIQLHKDALELRTSPHPERSTSLSGLADAIETLSGHSRDPSGIDKVISLRKEAIAYATTPALTRFSQALNWARFADENDHVARLDAHHSCINLLPQLAAFDLDLRSRRQMLTRGNIISLASNSAACAMSLGRNDVALEFLEASRSIFWAQALRLRTPLDHLEKIDRKLASDLREISRELEQGSFRDTSRSTEEVSQSHIIAIEAVGARCRYLQEKWTQTVKAVQELRGFEDFLRPKGIASLRQAAEAGPVVVLLTTQSTSSALIVTSSNDVQCVQLPRINQPAAARYAEIIQELTKHSAVDLNSFIEKRMAENESDSTTWIHVKSRLTGRRENSRMVSFDEFLNKLLGILWNDVVQSVLHFLNIQKSAQPSRLWWCPTGPFAFLPIHAAGIYDEDSVDFASQYVISSYAPTVTALLDAPTHTTASFQMSAIIQPDAPGCTPLPGTTEELEKITRHVSTTWLTVLSRPTRKQALDQLPKSSIAHFACHGIQDGSEPLNSGLMLADGRLKVSEIMKSDDGDSRQRGMSLAFLSACETTKGDKATPNEAIHLAASLMFSGFHSVVGTMWKMQDVDGPKVADGFYEHLFKELSMRTLGAFPLHDDTVDRIFTFCPTFDTLDSITLVSKAFYRIYLSDSDTPSHVGPALPQALKVLRYQYTLDGDERQQDDPDTLATEYLEDYNASLITAIEKEEFQQNSTIIAALEDIYSLTRKDRNSRTSVLTADESWRFQRAAYRIMLYCNLFSASNGDESDEDIIRHVQQQRTAVLQHRPTNSCNWSNIANVLLTLAPDGVKRAWVDRSYRSIATDIDFDCRRPKTKSPPPSPFWTPSSVRMIPVPNVQPAPGGVALLTAANWDHARLYPFQLLKGNLIYCTTVSTYLNEPDNPYNCY
ncbi:CHAT domain-containing protein [Mycena sanguinolenta]|nr:CHAT domain-containing protein [Mycena sanguinolenta]